MSGEKSHMQTEGVDERLLVNYLLGKLTEEEQVRVEDRAFANPEYMSALDAAEADLIDDYVSGDLSQADHRAFEERFLTSPQRRSNVAFARALAKVAAESVTIPTRRDKPDSGWLAFLNPMRAWNPALRFAGAMGAVVCMAGGVWLIVENTTMRSRLATLEAQHHEFEVRKEALEQALRQAQARPDSIPAQVPATAAPQTPRVPLVASLVLLAAPTRSEARVGQLMIDRGVQLAHIEIALEARDEFPRFRADLRTRGGKEVLSLSDLPRRRSGDGFSVAMDLPSSALSSGEYELALKGLREGEAPQEIGYYYFQVRKR